MVLRILHAVLPVIHTLFLSWLFLGILIMLALLGVFAVLDLLPRKPSQNN